MKVEQIIRIIDAKILTGEGMLGLDITGACGSDMMSDVLAFVKDQAALITGLLNPQVVRTAEMMDIHCIIFVRGKVPQSDVVDLAKQKEMVLLATELPMFTTCGLLYQNGLKGGGTHR